MSNADEGTSSSISLDAMSADPAHHTILLENEHVRILDTRVGEGERTAVHTHEWPAALYVLSFSDFVRHDAEGRVLLDSRSLAVKPTDGDALWGPPLVPHWVHNVGTKDLHVIAVELKPSSSRMGTTSGAGGAR